MPNYRIYELSLGNQIAGMRMIACATDQEAIEKAKGMLEGRDLEVWQGARVVSRLRHTDAG